MSFTSVPKVGLGGYKQLCQIYLVEIAMTLHTEQIDSGIPTFIVLVHFDRV